MKLIPYHEFLNNFPASKSLIFVGNAPSLLNENLGAWIDSHDYVVRFNESPIQGFEKDVGSKTDILVTNPYHEGKREIILTEKGIILIISSLTRRPPSETLRRWLKDYSTILTYAPDLVGVVGSEHKVGLTTGTYGIHLLSRILSPSTVSITGFTMFLDNTAHHYWQAEKPNGITAHDFIHEAKIFISLINSIRCEIITTSEISWVASKSNISLNSKIQIKKMESAKWD